MTLGWEGWVAAVTVLLVQGAITLGAGLFEDLLVGEALAVLTSAGGVTIVGIGLKLLTSKTSRSETSCRRSSSHPRLVGSRRALL